MTFPAASDGSVRSIIVLSEGAPADLGNATGLSSFAMSNSSPTRRWPDRALTKPGDYKNEVYVLPKQLDEKVARLHLGCSWVRLTELTKIQAE